jgi:uncharacterized protein YcbK (DUF882 family)
MKYFKESEFECACCGKNMMDKEFLRLLDVARHEAGIPFKINSGFRCEEHNKKVGGSETSTHLDGKAVDIACNNSVARGKIVSALIRQGVNRIGIHQDFIHADLDHIKLPAIWLY